MVRVSVDVGLTLRVDTILIFNLCQGCGVRKVKGVNVYRFVYAVNAVGVNVSFPHSSLSSARLTCCFAPRYSALPGLPCHTQNCSRHQWTVLLWEHPSAHTYTHGCREIIAGELSTVSLELGSLAARGTLVVSRGKLPLASLDVVLRLSGTSTPATVDARPRFNTKP